MENPMMKDPTLAATTKIGKRLVELCQVGKFHEATEELYGPGIVSIEPFSNGANPARVEGIDAVRKKGEWWTSNHEIHGCEVAGPYVHGERFVVYFDLDVTPKAGPMAGKRMHMKEVGVYTAKGGKVVHEEFFYGVG
jgi:hypothetical protein